MSSTPLDSEIIRLQRWDTTSEEQGIELKRQRVLCGWDSDKIPFWSEKEVDGSRKLFWIFAAETEAAKKRLKPLPDEEKLYLDRAAEQPTPANPAFRPLGHVCLALAQGQTTEYIVTTFFILGSQQGTGLGNIVMREVEVLARDELGVTALLIDTFDLPTIRDELSKQIALRFKPEDLRDNEAWYAKLGFHVTARGAPKYPDFDAAGNAILLPSVVMRKDLI